MDNFITLKDLKKFKKGETLYISRFVEDGADSFWMQPTKNEILGTSDYSLFARTLDSARTQSKYRWDDYEKYWRASSEINVVKEEIKFEEVDVAAQDENIIPLPEIKVLSAPSPDKEPDKEKEKEEKEVPKKNTTKKEKEALSDEEKKIRKARQQAAAIKKYTDKFERVNCRFPEGTIKKMSKYGYSSANKFINAAVEEFFKKKDGNIDFGEKETEIPSLLKSGSSNIVQMPSTRGITQKLYDSIQQEVEEQFVFLNKEMTVEDVLNILKKYVMI